MNLFTCDFCKKGPLPAAKRLYRPAMPEGWNALRINMAGTQQVNFDCCDECLVRLGVDTDSLASTPKDELFGIFQAMVEEAMEP